ncbi:hypothetical protein LS72_004970 [Helicobacter apodemus]|uniref:Uncharacterized protein n=1 Tax=Helicobacter apodemus TaxID=135569 RepID=A0A4U8UE87_9HELI|nr:hypothetical protein [Helicobacter apodemus]TLE16076.1 hypothetical protein LS72_004970 [Helicobacter apodemus]
MALKKVEINQKSLKAIENSGINIKSLTNDEFSNKINDFIIKGVEKIEISNENLLLLEGIALLGKKFNKESLVDELFNKKLKEIYHQLAETI